MKKLALLSFAIVLIISACNNPSTSSRNSTQTFNLDTTKLKNGESFYQCEMNPEELAACLHSATGAAAGATAGHYPQFLRHTRGTGSGNTATLCRGCHRAAPG